MRTTVEIILWFAFAWIYFLYLLVVPRARTEHIGVAGALMALIGAAELSVMLFVGAIWWMV